MAKKKHTIKRVHAACKEVGLKDSLELFKRAFRWANGFVLNMKKVVQDHSAFVRRGKLLNYVKDFIRGGHHKTFKFA